MEGLGEEQKDNLALRHTHVLMISNNALKYLTPPRSAIIRVNIAWHPSVEDLERALVEIADNNVCLDFPHGRTKPPTSPVSLKEAIAVVAAHKSIRYFAISNAEDVKYMAEVRGRLPEHAQMIPKIETPQGVRNVLDIASSAKTDVVMLDKEDLYQSAGDEYSTLLSIMKKTCRDKVNILELRGVLFSDMERGQ